MIKVYEVPESDGDVNQIWSVFAHTVPREGQIK